MTYEAKIRHRDGKTDWIDPVVKIIIDNGVHQYELSPQEISEINFRDRQDNE